jgi:hypothetical protein
MKLATPSILGFALICIAVAPASSQEFSLKSIDWSNEGDIDFAYMSDNALPTDRAIYADVRLRIEGEYVQSTQTRFGVRLAFAGLSSDGTRAAFGSVNCTTQCQNLLGRVSGLTGSAGIDPADDRFGIQAAELFLKRPFYEVRVGRTQTAMHLQTETPIRALRLNAADNDLIGPGFAMTSASLGESALGLSISSKRLAGFAASASYSVEENPCHFNACRVAAPVYGLDEVESIWSAATSYVHSKSGWRVELGGEWAQTDTSIGAVENPWSVRTALVRTFDDVSVFLSALTSNNGLNDGQYLAASLGLSLQQGDWLFSAETGYGRDDAFDTEGLETMIAGSRFVNDFTLFSIGLSAHNAYGDTEMSVISEIGLRF